VKNSSLVKSFTASTSGCAAERTGAVRTRGLAKRGDYALGVSEVRGNQQRNAENHR
jgi:hypothetical protein